MENIIYQNERLNLNAPYDMSNFVFVSPQLTVLEYVSGMGDFINMCNPFPSGEKPTIVNLAKKYFATYNFYSGFEFIKNRNRITPTDQQQITAKQLNITFDTSYSSKTIVVDGRDVDRGSVPATILNDKIQPQLKTIRLSTVEGDMWNNITKYINPLDIQLTDFVDLDDIVKQGKILEYAAKIKKEITKQVNYLKKLKIEWCSFYGIPKQDLIIYMTPEMLDALPLNNSMVYISNENIKKSAEQLFPEINGIKIIPSTNHKDYCGFDMLLTTNWTCSTLIADIGVRVGVLEGTARDLTLNAEFIADGKCKFYDPEAKDPKCPVMFGYKLKFKQP